MQVRMLQGCYLLETLTLNMLTREQTHKRTLSEADLVKPNRHRFSTAQHP